MILPQSIAPGTHHRREPYRPRATAYPAPAPTEAGGQGTPGHRRPTAAQTATTANAAGATVPARISPAGALGAKLEP